MNKYENQTEFYNRSYAYLELLKQHDEKWFNDYVKFITENIPKESKGLELGCGMGLAVKLLSDIGYDMIGVDISKLFLEQGGKEYNLPKEKLILADALHLPFKDKSFDFVCCIDFIEHVSDVKSCLKEIARVTKKYIVIFSPNYYDIFTWIKNIFTTTLFNKSLFPFLEILSFQQMFNLTVKIIGLYPLKILGIHKEPITFNPILSDEKTGGDYDLAWIINFFDIENLLKEYGFYNKNRATLFAKTRSFIKIFAERK